MARGTSVSVSAARWLVGVIASIVLCFTLATAVAEHLESAIAGRANDIVANAMPSVQMLSAARGNLRRLEADLDRYGGLPADQRLALRDRILATRQDIDGTLAEYTALPFFPRERGLYVHVEDALADLDAALPGYVSAREPATLAKLHHGFDILDEAIERVVSFDAAQGERLGLEIQHTRGDTRGVVVLLDAASVALAIGAAFLALRQLRRAARARKAEAEAHQRREAELRAQAEALGQFAGRVAHDVLSPLQTATLALEMVRGACEKNPSAHRATDQGIAAVARVHSLVDGLLAFSRAGGQPEPGASTEIAPVITDVVDGLSGQAREQRIRLTVGDIPNGSIACSKGVLVSLVSNLVRNAIKYMGDAPERRIDLGVIDAGDRWRVDVADTGPGIPSEQQERIFQPYVQLGRGAAGIGLGLATVDRLVRAHSGSLGVVSPPGRGSLFWFEIPKASAVAEVAHGRAAVEHAVT
jgi:signal transduction histidine kinase